MNWMNRTKDEAIEMLTMMTEPFKGKCYCKSDLPEMKIIEHAKITHSASINCTCGYELNIFFNPKLKKESTH